MSLADSKTQCAGGQSASLRSTDRSSGSGSDSTGLAHGATLVTTTGRADGTSDVARRALENWWNSTYANFSDKFVSSATILGSVRQSYLVTPEPGTPEITSDMLGTRGLNVFLRDKQYHEPQRCLENGKGYAAHVRRSVARKANNPTECPKDHAHRKPYAPSSMLCIKFPLSHARTPDLSPLPSPYLGF